MVKEIWHTILQKFMFQYWQRIGLDEEYQIVPVPIFTKKKKEAKI